MRLLITLLLALATTAAAAAPGVDLWKRWDQHSKDSEKTIDHSAWTDFLQVYVVDNGPGKVNRVRYGDVSKADRKALQHYIHRLEGVAIADYTRDEQRAFWMNLYNAVVVNLVLQHYPVDSIRDIGGGLFGNGPWDEKRVTVGGAKLSLNDIEYRILRPIWHDELTQYGLFQATIAAPDLLTKAFTGKNVWLSLRHNAKAYINSPRGVRFDKNGHLFVSRIYKRHMNAYGDIEAGLIMHLRRFAKPQLSLRLDAAEGIDGYFYDWALNAAAEAPNDSSATQQ